jgi:hypothetical protein
LTAKYILRKFIFTTNQQENLMAFDAYLPGTEVSYVKMTPIGEIKEGTALIRGSGLDHTLRPVYTLQLPDGKCFNVATIAVNLKDEDKQAYIDGIHAVRNRATEAQDFINEHTIIANKDIKELTTKVFGGPLEQMLPSKETHSDDVPAVSKEGTTNLDVA